MKDKNLRAIANKLAGAVGFGIKELPPNEDPIIILEHVYNRIIEAKYLIKQGVESLDSKKY